MCEGQKVLKVFVYFDDFGDFDDYEDFYDFDDFYDSSSWDPPKTLLRSF